LRHGEFEVEPKVIEKQGANDSDIQNVKSYFRPEDDFSWLAKYLGELGMEQKEEDATCDVVHHFISVDHESSWMGAVISQYEARHDQGHGESNVDGVN